MTITSFKWFGNEVNKDIVKATQLAILESANDLAQRSSDEAPIKDGDLRGNVAIDDSNLETGFFVEVGYNLVYAMIQHERLDFSHPQGGKAKYLEDPFNANIRNYQRHISEAVDRVTT